jgi:hypothetical protein
MSAPSLRLRFAGEPDLTTAVDQVLVAGVLP